MTDNKLEVLFNQCDKNGSGYISRSEFQAVCNDFEIRDVDADTIFTDLDHDGDGRISFQDFSYGFRDFLVPGSRRGSIQLGIEPSIGNNNGRAKKFHTMTKVEEEKLINMERNHDNAKRAWEEFTAHMSEAEIKKILGKSGDKVMMLYEQMQNSEAPCHLVSQFEDVISSVINDIQNIEKENKTMEEKYFKERETHTQHLKNIEAEMDAQVARVERIAAENAKNQYEMEKREIQSKMETEMSELKVHLNLFKKVDNWLQKDKVDSNHKEHLKKLDMASSENMELKSNLLETQARISLLTSDFMELRNQYEEKCMELNHEREDKIEYMYEVDNIQRQLEILRGANLNLKDSNDGLQSLIESRPRTPLSFEFSVPNMSGTLCEEIRDTEANKESLNDQYDLDLNSDQVRFLDPCYGEDIGEDELRSSPDFEIGAPFNPNKSKSFPPSMEGDKPSISSIGSAQPFNKRMSSFRSSKRKKSPSVDRFLNQRQSSPYRSNITSFLEPTGPPDRTYKVVFAGDAAVGKSSFINRITKGCFVENLSSTLGVDFQVKTIRVDERNIALQLWDTAGQERFRSVIKSYFRRADGVMLLYDVTSDRSYLSVRQWIQAVDDVSEKRIPIMLCANKVDLREEAIKKGTRCVSTEEGEKMARDYSAIFIETSTKSGNNVWDAVIQLSRDMCSSEDVEVQTSALQIRPNDKKSECCGKKRQT
ncbi:ras and EF-hand domain-containing protein homolog isoform X2 [Lepeophtheirus salmonis]|uniref:ras and EF-hand domain-containing protein homolog isoform X2 n=1 Tax=Lepeophtheirus salmonis TaxID=72036 RepID=UPI001AEAF0B5|nr:ras and EF-hand domain-containing protein homolog isoform X2 [Lepeophtheirus salmonis]